MPGVFYDHPASLDTAEIVRGGTSTGVYSGGVLSVGSPNTTFTISDGAGVIAGDSTVTDVTWTGKTNLSVTNLATHLITFVSIDSAGDVVQRTTRWDGSASRDEIILGVVVHVNKTIVDTVNNEQQPSRNVGAQLGDLFKLLGFFNSSGNIFSSSGADLTVDKTEGIMVGYGVNYANDVDSPHGITLAALTNASFQYRFQDGTNGTTDTTIDPNIWDVGGTSTAVSTNKWTVQRIYSFTSNNVKIQPGQTEYGSLALAEDAIPNSSFVTEPSIDANGMLRGFLVVQQGSTDLSDAAQAKFLRADQFGESRI